MKTDRYNMEDLLSDVEHAGRDARRQQELGDMVDRLAASESGKQHGFWWWSTRVAAAACVLFFISTAVRIWFIPSDSARPEVAEALIPTQPPIVADSVLPIAPAANAIKPAGIRRIASSPVVTTPSSLEETAAEDEPVVPMVEEFMAEEFTVEQESLSDSLDTEDSLTNTIDDLVSPIVSIACEPQTEPQTEAPHEKRERRSFLASLFRPAEPSLMDGTTLTLLSF